jgi:hypothetical protein
MSYHRRLRPSVARDGSFPMSSGQEHALGVLVTNSHLCKDHSGDIPQTISSNFPIVLNSYGCDFRVKSQKLQMDWMSTNRTVVCTLILSGQYFQFFLCLFKPNNVMKMGHKYTRKCY